MKRNFWAAIVIALFGGFIGLQHFYVKQTIWGIFGVIFCWTGIPAIVAFVQAMIWLFKGKEQFEIKFK